MPSALELLRAPRRDFGNCVAIVVALTLIGVIRWQPGGTHVAFVRSSEAAAESAGNDDSWSNAAAQIHHQQHRQHRSDGQQHHQSSALKLRSHDMAQHLDDNDDNANRQAESVPKCQHHNHQQHRHRHRQEMQQQHRHHHPHQQQPPSGNRHNDDADIDMENDADVAVQKSDATATQTSDNSGIDNHDKLSLASCDDDTADTTDTSPEISDADADASDHNDCGRFDPQRPHHHHPHHHRKRRHHHHHQQHQDNHEHHARSSTTTVTAAPTIMMPMIYDADDAVAMLADEHESRLSATDRSGADTGVDIENANVAGRRQPLRVMQVQDDDGRPNGPDHSYDNIAVSRNGRNYTDHIINNNNSFTRTDDENDNDAVSNRPHQQHKYERQRQPQPQAHGPDRKYADVMMATLPSLANPLHHRQRNMQLFSTYQRPKLKSHRQRQHRHSYRRFGGDVWWSSSSLATNNMQFIDSDQQLLMQQQHDHDADAANREDAADEETDGDMAAEIRRMYAAGSAATGGGGLPMAALHWPVKKEAIMEGDLVLGGLMMVHSREDTMMCGPIMPQGGIQALEAMLYTLDRINRDGLLPNITIGAHILDDCDRDSYGLEMAVDFIKGESLVVRGRARMM